MRKNPARFFEYYLVTAQFICLGVIVVSFFPPPLWHSAILTGIGCLLVVCGVLLGLWAIVSFKQTVRVLPSPSVNSSLVLRGPYAYIRHPMYSALLIASIGVFVAYPTVTRFCAMGVLYLVLRAKMIYEERLLTERFIDYNDYTMRIGKLLPKIQRPRTS